jgi:O-methyltransferase
MECLKRLLKILGMFYYARNLAGRLRGCLDRNCFLASLPYDRRRLFVESHDPVRYGAIALALERLRKEGISGSLAEVGVWRGYTSKIIHDLESERELYLFDTFEGFPMRDLEEGRTDGRFRDTNVEIVKKTIGRSENITIIPGYFPESAQDLVHERFAFVMLDVDLFNPTLAALCFFYDKINAGGYIFIHDYNSPESDWAVFRATNEFMKDKPEKMIEIPDMSGSVIFRKL